MSNQSEAELAYNSDDYFGNYTDQEFQCDKKTLRIYSYIILGPGVVGILGNVLAAFILHKQQANTANTMILLLKVLALLDTLYVTDYIATIHLTHYFFYESFDVTAASNVFTIAAEPLLFFFQMCTVWVTVIIAVVRYVAVCRPFTASELCKRRNIWLAIAIVTITQALIHIPWFLTYRLVKSPQLSIDGPQWELQLTNLSQLKSFTFGYRTVFMDICMRGVLPLFIISLCNVRLLCALYRQPCATNVSHRHSLQQAQLQEAVSVTKAVILLTAVFILTYFPHTGNAILQEVNSDLVKVKCGSFKYYLTFVFDAMMFMNSCINFILYYGIRESFREKFMAICCAFCINERSL